MLLECKSTENAELCRAQPGYFKGIRYGTK